MGAASMLARAVVAVAALTALLAPPPPAIAQGQSARTITMIVPFAAGGPTDTIARLAAEHMGRTLGRQIIVENVGGAGGTTGSERASRAAPDAATLLLNNNGLASGMALYANLKYDALASFEPLGLVNTGPMVLIGRKSLPADNADALADWLKAQGDKAILAHAGVGSNSYLCHMLMSQIAGVKPSLVPYRGAGPAMNDLVAGQVDVHCEQATTATAQIQAATIKAYVVTSSERLATLPDVPAASETKLKGLDLTFWNGLYAPKGTPKEITEPLHAALQAFIDDPATVQRLADSGTTSFPRDKRTPAEHRRFLEAEVARYKKLIDSSGLKPAEAK